MSVLLPAVVDTLVCLMILTLVYYFLYTRKKTRPLQIWTLSWFFYSLRLVLEILKVLIPETALTIILFQLVTLTSGILLLWGIYLFNQKPFALFWKVGIVLSIIWVLVALLVNAPSFWINFPTFTFLALVYIWNGILFLRLKEVSRFNRYFSGIAFILWGLHRADYPFLQPLTWFAPWGYLLGSCLSIVAGLSILLIYFDRMEAELKDNQKKFRTVADFTYDWEYWIGPDRRIIYMSPSCERITGYSVEEFVQSPGLLEQIVYFQDRPKINRHFEEVLQDNEFCALDFRIVSRSGQIYWIGHVCQAVYSEDGLFLGRRASNRDITERKQAEENLEKREQQYRFLTENMKDVVWVLDVETLYFRYVSPSVERLRGYTVEEITLKPMDDALLPEDRKYLRNLINMRVRDFLTGKASPDQFYTNEIEQPRKDGSTVWTEAITRYYLNEERGKVEIIGVTREISERKKSEAEIHALNLELEQRVVDQTAQVGVLNHELEAFSYSVSHDLRAPLRTLEGFSQMILEDYGHNLDATGKDYLNRIRSASRRMASLIDDLLYLSRISRSVPNFTEVDLSSMARKIFNELQAIYPHHPVESLITPSLVVRADANMIRTVLMNLLNNAFKFTLKSTEACIEVGCQYMEGKQVFYVKDNGIGFNMAHANKMFNAFQRLHSQSEYEGNGMGLAIVKRIILHHGGRIWVESAVDQGATFYFTLS